MPTSSKGLRIVIVDDSADIQQRMRRLLTEVPGLDVVGSARDRASAIRTIDDQRPDVVLLDVDLDHGDRGMDVLRHVARDHAGTQVVVLSNFSWRAMRDAFLAAGAAAYFDKAMEFNEARDWIAAHRPLTARSVTS
jgi:two-component system chemotaxis response regulator CheB